MLTARLPLSAARDNLQRLLAIRLVVMLGLIAGLLFAWYGMAAPLNYPLISLVLTFMLVMSLLTIARLQWRWPVTDPEYFAQLCFDLLALALVLYLSGGATNPFISCFLVLLTVSAATLPWHYTLCYALLMMLAYSLLLKFYQPLQMTMDHGSDSSLFNLHILGMWLTFIISAALISVFVVRMAQALRQQDQILARRREDDLHDEQLLAVATLAAGTAHELGTPMATLSLLVEDIKSKQEAAQLTDDLQIMTEQIDQCRQVLQRMRSRHEPALLAQTQVVAADHFMAEVIDSWQLMRPDVQCQYQLAQAGPAPAINSDETLRQALTNLLNNAADASELPVSVTLGWNDKEVDISIRDQGPGIAMELADQLGKPFVSNKHSGLGLGVFLSQATVARFQGQVACFNHKDGGILTEIRLPVVTVDDGGPLQ